MRKEIPQETVYLIIHSWFFFLNNKNEGKTNKQKTEPWKKDNWEKLAAKPP